MPETMTKERAANLLMGRNVQERRGQIAAKIAETDQNLALVKDEMASDARGFFAATTEAETDDVNAAVRLSETSAKSLTKKLSMLEAAARGLDVADKATPEDVAFVRSHRDDVLRILRLNPKAQDRAKALKLIRAAQTK